MGSESKEPEQEGQKHKEGRSTMMSWEQKSFDQSLNMHDDTDRLFCKLFADDVPTNVCTLRKRELNGRGEFTCVGCNRALS